MREEDTRRQETIKEKRNRLRYEVQRRCRKARNIWIEGECKEAESLFKIGKVDAARKKIRENFKERLINANIVRGGNGKALKGSRDKVNRRVEYIESLYKDDAVADLIENENGVQNDDRRNLISKKELEKALRAPKANIPPEVDLIAAELLHKIHTI